MPLLILLSILLVGCGQTKKETKKVKTNEALDASEEIIAAISYPENFQLEYQGQILADLSQVMPIVTSYGSVSRGVTLNQLTIDGLELIVYGEDGVFAAECESHVNYPGNGPGHPLCQVEGAESFDKIIVCSSTLSSTPIMTAQNWPGTETAMTDESLGMNCWVNGVKMLSNKIFTY